MATSRSDPVRRPSLRKDTARWSRSMTDRAPPFRRVLVANRGEIAVRIIRACHELGMEAVAVYSDADADAAHVRLADAAVRLGPPSPARELPADRRGRRGRASRPGLRRSIRATGSWPNGRRSPGRSRTAGLVFVGPSSATIEALGRQAQRAAPRGARRRARPCRARSSRRPSIDPTRSRRSWRPRNGIGFPLLVKAAAGGGGRGMRRVIRARGPRRGARRRVRARRHPRSAMDPSTSNARSFRRATSRSSSSRTTHGHVVALGERDCSLQRRHQKLVEEAPAPGLTEEQRRHLHALAVRLGEAAGAPERGHLRVPPRPGRQLLVPRGQHAAPGRARRDGAGRRRGHRPRAVPDRGRRCRSSAEVVAAGERAATPASHAIEVRIAAEDPSRAFAPTPGRVGRWVMPSGPGVRVDTAIESGDRVPPDYDNLIAKLMVHAQTAMPRSTGCAARWTRRRSAASRRPCRSIGASPAATRSAARSCRRAGWTRTGTARRPAATPSGGRCWPPGSQRWTMRRVRDVRRRAGRVRPSGDAIAGLRRPTAVAGDAATRGQGVDRWPS